MSAIFPMRTPQIDLAEANGPTARQHFLGVPIDCLTMTETIAEVGNAIASGRTCQQVCLNVTKFVAMRSNAELNRDVCSSHIISIDGMGIVWAARLLGIAVPERVPGIDLMQQVLHLCEVKNYRPFFLGARPSILTRAVYNVQTRYPKLEVAGWHHGYFDLEAEPAVVATIKSSRADCLFIGMPTPRKERFLAAHREVLGVPFIMGVGGGLDVISGEIHRAPRVVQRIGLEWLFRTAQEPLRLGPRYAKSNIAFAGILAKAVWSGRRADRRAKR
jgi:N-acetylglucosaminyldiphosphoundecaprenol N-acetyl-beta-D-mannosaminyltransferase